MELTLTAKDLNLADKPNAGCDALLLSLIERARQHDGAAFEEIMLRYQQKVLSTSWRILGNREDARDAAQDTFVRVHRYLKSYRPDQDFEGWLYRIIVNVCRDIARKRPPAQSPIPLELGGHSFCDPALISSQDVEGSALRAERQKIIVRALATLSKKEREALVLRDLEGLSTEEVARALNSSATTVRSQISSARGKIKRFRDELFKQTRRG